MKEKGFFQILLIIGLFLILVLTASLIFIKKNSNSLTSSNPNTTTNSKTLPTPTPKQLTNNKGEWKIYKSANFKWQIAYPPDWNIEANDYYGDPVRKIPGESVLFNFSNDYNHPTKDKPVIKIYGNYQSDVCAPPTCEQETVMLGGQKVTKLTVKEVNDMTYTMTYTFHYPSNLNPLWNLVIFVQSNNQEELVKKVFDSFKFLI